LPIEPETQQVTIPKKPKQDNNMPPERKHIDPATSEDINIMDGPIVVNPEEELQEEEGSLQEEIEGKSETTKKTKVKTGGGPDSEEAGSSSSSLPYSAFANALAEGGVIGQFDKKVFESKVKELGSPAAALIDLVRETIEDGIAADRASLTPEQSEYLEMLKDGIPHEQAASMQSIENRYNSITPDAIDDDEDLAVGLVSQMLAIRGFQDEEADELIETYKTSGKIKTNAKQALSFLQNYAKQVKAQEMQKVEVQRQTKVAQAKQFADQVKTTLEKTNELFGQKLTNKTKAKIYQAVAMPIVVDKNTGMQLNLIGKKRMENMVDFDVKLATLITLGMFDGDISKVVNNSRSKAIEELDSVLNTTSGSMGGGAGRRPSPTTQRKDSGKSTDILESLRRITPRTPHKE
jgi:hypothetical protein